MHYPLKKQRDIVIACVVLYNLIKLFSDEVAVFNPEDSVVDDDDDDEDDVATASTQQQTEENNYMATFRDELANMI